MPVKDTFVAYLLFFLFSVLGVHKFYLRKPLIGILYIFTLGLCGFGLLYDLFTLPSQVRLVNLTAASQQPQVVVNNHIDPKHNQGESCNGNA